MDSGSGSPSDPPNFGPGSPGYGPGGQPPPPEPRSPAPGPQSPAPGPQSPAPAPPPAQQPESPAPGGQPAAPPPYSPPAPPAGPEVPGAPPAPGYGGPVPPGGWQQSPPHPSPWAGQAPLASWGSRAGAYLVDGLIVFVPASILFFTIVGGAVGSGDDDVAWVGAVLGFVGWMLSLLIITLVYGPVLMSRSGENNGQTWGKQLLGIRAVRDNGQPWTYGPAAVREVLLKNFAVALASSIIPVIPWFLNFFWPLWDDENRALHDMACSSHVVKA